MPKMARLKTKSPPSNPQLVCDKEAVILMEKMSDSTIAEMTSHRFALQTQRGKKMPKMARSKTKSPPSNPQLVCDKEAVICLEKLSDSTIAEMTTHRSALQFQPVMESNNETFNINFLRDEILIEIFKYLSHNELGHIARVCRRWNVLSRSDILWHKVNVKFRLLHGFQNTFFMKFINVLPPSVTQIRLHFEHDYGWTEPLKFEEISARLQQRCPHLKILILKRAELSNGLSSVIQLCNHFLQELKVLVFHQSKFPVHKAECDFDSISKIKVLDLYGCEFEPLNKLLFSRMPNLKHLYLSCTYQNYLWFLGAPSFLNQLRVLDLGSTLISITSGMFEAIRRQGLNLEELYMCYAYIQDDDLSFPSTFFCSLKTICLKKCHNVSCEGVMSLVQSCQSLQNVYVDEEIAESYVAHPFIIVNQCRLLDIVKNISCKSHRKLINV